jgi:hypothetical protein
MVPESRLADGAVVEGACDIVYELRLVVMRRVLCKNMRLQGCVWLFESVWMGVCGRRREGEKSKIAYKQRPVHAGTITSYQPPGDDNNNTITLLFMLRGLAAYVAAALGIQYLFDISKHLLCILCL